MDYIRAVLCPSSVPEEVFPNVEEEFELLFGGETGWGRLVLFTLLFRSFLLGCLQLQEPAKTR